MAKPVNVRAAKAHFSRLVQRAAKGEEIIIAKAGKPVALDAAGGPSASSASAWPAQGEGQDRGGF